MLKRWYPCGPCRVQSTTGSRRLLHAIVKAFESTDRAILCERDEEVEAEAEAEVDAEGDSEVERDTGLR